MLRLHSVAGSNQILLQVSSSRNIRAVNYPVLCRRSPPPRDVLFSVQLRSSVVHGFAGASVHGIEQYRHSRQRHQNENDPEEQPIDDLCYFFPPSAVVVRRHLGSWTRLRCRWWSSTSLNLRRQRTFMHHGTAAADCRPVAHAARWETTAETRRRLGLHHWRLFRYLEAVGLNRRILTQRHDVVDPPLPDLISNIGPSVSGVDTQQSGEVNEYASANTRRETTVDRLVM